MKPNFEKLWNGYPTEDAPCDGGWGNQGAIRMSVALNAEGTIKISSATYSEPRCAHGHARGAESLATHLWRVIERPAIYTDGKAAKKKLAGKNGIIFFKDCFTRSGETARRGDHIDLWQLGTPKGFDDPDNHAAQIWFWSLP